MSPAAVSHSHHALGCQCSVEPISPAWGTAGSGMGALSLPPSSLSTVLAHSASRQTPALTLGGHEGLRWARAAPSTGLGRAGHQESAAGWAGEALGRVRLSAGTCCAFWNAPVEMRSVHPGAGCRIWVEDYNTLQSRLRHAVRHCRDNGPSLFSGTRCLCRAHTSQPGHCLLWEHSCSTVGFTLGRCRPPPKDLPPPGMTPPKVEKANQLEKVTLFHPSSTQTRLSNSNFQSLIRAFPC